MRNTEFIHRFVHRQVLSQPLHLVVVTPLFPTYAHGPKLSTCPQGLLLQAFVAFIYMVLARTCMRAARRVVSTTVDKPITSYYSRISNREKSMIVTIKCFDTACGGATGPGGNYESFERDDMGIEAADIHIDNLIDQGWVISLEDVDQALYGLADVEVTGQCPQCAAMAGN